MRVIHCRSNRAVPLNAEVALDMVYAAGETPWVRAMRSRVRRAADGRVMLVAQGARHSSAGFLTLRRRSRS